ncbi:MAG: LacI family DNA-binding transcriptional regulator [Propionibacteriaceae bacterium]
MSATVTIRDVAKAANVSLATASRVLAGMTNVRPETSERVQKAAQELDYRPNRLAQSLRNAKTGSVGLLVSDIRNPHFAWLAHGIQTQLASQGLVTIFGNASEDTTGQDAFLDHVESLRIDGLIIAPQSAQSESLRRIVDAGIPTVFVDRLASGFEVPAAYSDSESGIVEALDHLAELGHRHVGLIAGPSETSTAKDRRRAFKTHASRRFDEIVIKDGTKKGPVAAAEAMLAEGCSAIIMAYGPHTPEVFEALTRKGYQIPDDLSLITFDDQPGLRLTNPRFTVIAQDIDAMADEAVALLRAAMAGEHPDSVVLPTSLLVRDSTAAPAAQKKERA